MEALSRLHRQVGLPMGMAMQSLPHTHRPPSAVKSAHGFAAARVHHSATSLWACDRLYACCGTSLAPRNLRRAMVAAAPSTAEVAPATVSPATKTYDVVHLGNLCLDIIVPFDEIPPPDPVVRAELLAQLTAAPPPNDMWEVGGASNFMITAARLGQRVACLGQLGPDVYGEFFSNVMEAEHVAAILPLDPAAAAQSATLLCFVLVGPQSEHAFTSRYDFGPWPLLGGVTALRPQVLQVLGDTRALMLNGFVLDELPGAVVVAAAQATRAAGGSVFFDPGPRSWTLLQGERRGALDALLDVADVVLMTQEEAEAVTGCADPAAAGAWVLGRCGAATSWAVVKQGGDGAVLCARGAAAPIHIDALQVPVVDTVGCGDSFAAAVALGFTRGQSPEATLALANAVGAATAMGRGAGRSVAGAGAVMALLVAQTQIVDPLAMGAPGATDAASAAAVSAVQSPAPALSSNGSGGGSLQSEQAVSRAQQQDARVDAFAWQAPHPPAADAIQLLVQSLNDSDLSEPWDADQTSIEP